MGSMELGARRFDFAVHTPPCETGRQRFQVSNHDCNHPWGPWIEVFESGSTHILQEKQREDHRYAQQEDSGFSNHDCNHPLGQWKARVGLTDPALLELMWQLMKVTS